MATETLMTVAEVQTAKDTAATPVQISCPALFAAEYLDSALNSPMVRLAFVQSETLLFALQHRRPVALAGGLSNSLLSGVRDVSIVISKHTVVSSTLELGFFNLHCLGFFQPRSPVQDRGAC